MKRKLFLSILVGIVIIIIIFVITVQFQKTKPGEKENPGGVNVTLTPAGKNEESEKQQVNQNIKKIIISPADFQALVTEDLKQKGEQNIRGSQATNVPQDFATTINSIDVENITINNITATANVYVFTTTKDVRTGFQTKNKATYGYDLVFQDTKWKVSNVTLLNSELLE